MRFSLIVATAGRVVEVRELLASLSNQTVQDFEVIVVDQNADDRLGWLETEAFPFPIRRLRSGRRQLSHARNLGLREAVGEIAAFPDDDCTYPSELLARVDATFRERPGLGFCSGPSETPAGGLGSGRWRTRSGPIDAANVWTSVIEFNMFFRRAAVEAVGGFDERLGLGARFGSAEGNDLALRLVHTGWEGWYDFAQRAVHPDKRLTPAATERAFSYGAGLGYALRKNMAPLGVRLNFLVRPLGGCLLNFARGRWLAARYHWRALRGRIWGLCAAAGEDTGGLTMAARARDISFRETHLQRTSTRQGG